jgi:uncharacterized coiled-coil protein SlyX
MTKQQTIDALNLRLSSQEKSFDQLEKFYEEKSKKLENLNDELTTMRKKMDLIAFLSDCHTNYDKEAMQKEFYEVMLGNINKIANNIE